LKVEQNIFCELELTALQLSSTFLSLAASTRPSTVPFLLSLGQPSLPSSWLLCSTSLTMSVRATNSFRPMPISS
jgi:hypothetical protein